MSDNPIRYFKTEFLPEVKEFLKTVDNKAVAKIFWNLDLAERTNDPKLFKKLTHDVWEFRTLYQGLQYRLLAFWDKTNTTQTLVIATHGIIKKRDKMSGKEIEKTETIRKNYFNQKKK
ncbi:MAG: type II toxin-antitoxin system RelE/ParE family toxin [Ginsengibacter sp.]